MEELAQVKYLFVHYQVHYWFLFLLCFSLLFIRGRSARKLFNLPFSCFFIGGDIGGIKKPVYIAKKNIIGAPDAVFFDWLRLSFVIGEYKSRHYKQHIKPREQYQVMIYVGLLPPFWFPRCKGYIAYGCGEVVNIPFDRKLYKSLIKLESEVKAAKKGWTPANFKPLIER